MKMGQHFHTFIKIAIVLTSYLYCIESIAVMSVDFGGEFMKIAIVKPGIPMEVVLNKESQRKTATVVSIKDGERLIGEPALQLSTKFPQNAFKYVSTILGKKFQHPHVKLYKERFPYYNMEEDPETGGVIFKLDGKTWKPEELVAMILDKAREVAEIFAEQAIKDIVVTVPAYYNQAERRAMIRAVSLLDMNLLQLMSDNAAVALNYGVFRRKVFNTTAQVYMFYDMGATSTTASIVSYQVVKMKDRGFAEDNPQLHVMGVGFDPTLGSLAFQLRLRDHLVNAFNAQKKTKTEVSTNARSLEKLMKEAGRVMKVLSANSETYAQIEGLIDEIDFRHKVTRDEFESMCADLFERVSKPVTDAFLSSQVTEAEIMEVILMGGGTRIPKVKDTLLAVTGKKELGKSINTDEAAAMGAVYQTAYLSKGYKVKRFGVKEASVYPIQVEFERVRTEDEVASADKPKIIKRTLFNRMNPFPQKKVMTFNKHAKDFTFHIRYGDLSFLPKDLVTFYGDLGLSKVDLSGVTGAHNTNLGAVAKGVKAHFKMDESGIITMNFAEAVFEKENPVEEESTLSKLGSTLSNLFSSAEDKKEAEAPEKEGEGADKTGDAKTDGDQKPEEKTEDAEKKADEKKETAEDEKAAGKKSEESENKEQVEKKATEPPSDENKTGVNATDGQNDTTKEPAKPKIHVIRENITIGAETIDIREPSADTLKTSKALLDELRKVEKERVDWEKAKNDLESAVLTGRERFYQDDYLKCSTDDEREKLQAKFSEHSDWLDENGDTADKETLVNRFTDIKDETRDLYERVREYQERPKLIDSMKNMLNQTEFFYVGIKNLTTGEDPIFTEVELNTLGKVKNETEAWFKTAWKQLNESDPTLKAPYNRDDFAVKLEALDREIKYLISKAKSFKPKPKPAKPKTSSNDTNGTVTNDTASEGNEGVKLESMFEEKDEGKSEAEDLEENATIEEEPLQLGDDGEPNKEEEPIVTPKTKTKTKRHDPSDEL